MNVPAVRAVEPAIPIDQLKVLQHLGLNPAEPAAQAAVLVCERYGLDPVLKHVILIQGRVYVTRDGLLSIAHRSGMFDGVEVLEQGETQTHFTAKVAVYRKDMTRPFTFIGRYPKTGGNKLYGPEMAVKCGEVMGYRRAFNIAVQTHEERWDLEDDSAPPHQSTSAPDAPGVRFQGAPGAPAEVDPTRQESEAPGLAPLAGASGATQGAEAGGIPDEPGRNSQPPASPSRRPDPLDRDDDARWSEPAQRALTDLDQMADDLADAGAVADRRRLWLALSGHRINDTRPFEELRADDWPERMGAWDTARWAEAEAVLTAKLAPQEAAS